MGDEDQRGAVLAVQREQQVGDFIPGVTVEVAGGFIGEQQLRAAVKRARQRDPLLLAAGELYRQVMQAFAQPQLLQQRPGAAAALAIAFAAQQRRKLNVFQRIEGGYQHKRLKHKADVLSAQLRPRLFVHLVQRLSEQQNLPAAAVVQPGEDRQQR